MTATWHRSRVGLAAGAELSDADPWMTGDGVIVAHQHRNLSSGTDGSGNIDQHNGAERQTGDLRSGRNGDPIGQLVRIASLHQIRDALQGRFASRRLPTICSTQRISIGRTSAAWPSTPGRSTIPTRCGS